jgi:putative membrane protein
MQQPASESSVPVSRERPLGTLPAFLCGSVMGAADAIPGVSGGTMALILGIYERFIDALGTVIRLPQTLRTAEGRARLRGAFALLIPLGCGVLLALYGATKLLVGKADEQGLLQAPESAPFCFAFFFGIVVVSAAIPWNRIAEHSIRTAALAALGAVAAFTFAGLEHVKSEPPDWMLVPGGALAITVMLLPGISGSLMLVLLNQYQTVTTALHERDATRLLLFLLGVVTGAAIFIPLLRRLMRRAHDPTMAVLTGLMVGSLRALWPWKTNYDHKSGAMTNYYLGEIVEGPASWILVVATVGIGASVVLILSRVEKRIREHGTRGEQ